jgi:SNF2 family DNA or RNA helicase
MSTNPDEVSSEYYKVGESTLFRKVRDSKLALYYDCVNPGDAFVDLSTIRQIVEDKHLSEPFVPKRFDGPLIDARQPTPYPCIVVAIEQNRNTLRVFDAGAKSIQVAEDLDLPDDMECIVFKARMKMVSARNSFSMNTIGFIGDDDVQICYGDDDELPTMSTQQISLAYVVKKAEKYLVLRQWTRDANGARVGPPSIIVPWPENEDEVMGHIAEFISRYTTSPISVRSVKFWDNGNGGHPKSFDEVFGAPPTTRLSHMGVKIEFGSDAVCRPGSIDIEQLPGARDSDFVDLVREHTELVSLWEYQNYNYNDAKLPEPSRALSNAKYKLHVNPQTGQYSFSVFIPPYEAERAAMSKFDFCPGRPDLLPITPSRMYDTEVEILNQLTARRLFHHENYREFSNRTFTALINAMANSENQYHLRPDKLYESSVSESIDVVNATDWLYEFQKETVRNMILHETCEDGTASLYGSRLTGESFSTGVMQLFNDPKCRFVPEALADNLKRTTGILADEPGMGKTRQCISLIKATANRATSATLIIVQPTVFNQWRDEINAVWPEADLYMYYGRWRNHERLNEAFVNADIVLTTTGTLSTNIGEFAHRTWFRLIADESHAMPHSLSNGIRIGFIHKWGVTGTPGINYKKHLSWLFQEMFWPALPMAISSEDHHFFNSPTRIWRFLRPITFRKTRDVHLNLPEVHEHTVMVELSQRERSRYTDVANSMRNSYPNGVFSMTTVTNYYNMLQGIATMSDDIDGKISIIRSSGNAPEVFSKSAFIQPEQVPQDECCPICIDAFEDVCKTACGHFFCTECLSLHVSRSMQCPLCRGRIDRHSVQKCPPAEVDGAADEPATSEISSKAIRITDDIRRILRSDPKSKVLVFFHHMYTLEWFRDVIRERIGVECLTVSGTDPVARRSKHFSLFQNSDDPGHRVMFMTTRCAAAGITLTRADHVMTVAPSVQHALDHQLIGRAHRIGRADRPVNFYRYVAKDTVEEIVVNHVGGDSAANMQRYAVNTTIESMYD